MKNSHIIAILNNSMERLIKELRDFSVHAKRVFWAKLFVLVMFLVCLGVSVSSVSKVMSADFDLRMKQVYPVGQSFEVDYAGSTEESWLGLYNAGEGLENEIQWIAIPADESDSGTATFEGLPVGNYQLAFYRYGTDPVVVREFTVTDSELYMDRVCYEQGSHGTLTIEKELKSDTAWIGVYPKDEVPGENNCLFWEYVNAFEDPTCIDLNQLQTKGSFSRLPVGEYVLYLFENDSYTVEEEFAFSVISNSHTRLVYLPEDDAPKTTMNGQIIITPGTKVEDYYWLVWANEEGPISGYSPLGKIKSKETESLVLKLHDNIAAPAGADRILVYGGSENYCWKSTVLGTLELSEEAIADQETEYSFAVLSDIHISQNAYYIYNRNYTRAIRDIIKNMPDVSAIIYPGDLTNNGKPIEFSVLGDLLKQFQKLLPPQYLIMGNHDLGLNKESWGQKVYNFLGYTDMPNYYYSFELNDTSFICLGSDDATSTGSSVSAVIGEAQRDWLEEELKKAEANHPESPIFVIIHQPLYDTLVGTSSSIIEGGEELRALLDQYPQTIVISGHSHSALNRYYTVYDGGGEGASMIHAGSVSALWDNTAVGSGPDDSGGSYDGSQGIMVEVCEDYIRVRSRDFKTGEWMGDAERIVWFHQRLHIV